MAAEIPLNWDQDSALQYLNNTDAQDSNKQAALDHSHIFPHGKFLLVHMHVNGNQSQQPTSKREFIPPTGIYSHFFELLGLNYECSNKAPTGKC